MKRPKSSLSGFAALFHWKSKVKSKIMWETGAFFRKVGICYHKV